MPASTTDTPGPCGCWVYRPTEAYAPVIVYCPTHAAAFEMQQTIVVLGHQRDDLEAQNADLLAALKEIAADSLEGLRPPSGGGWPTVAQSVARAAIARAEG